MCIYRALGLKLISPSLPPSPSPCTVSHTVKKLPSVDTQHGTLSFPISTYCSLNPAIARRSLSVWIRYIGGVSDVRYDLTVSMHRMLVGSKKLSNVTGSNIILTFDPECKRSAIARRSPESKYRVKVPIKVGETILWDSRFQISLVPRDSRKRDKQNSNKMATSSEDSAAMFYVRHLIQRDWPYMSKRGNRYKLPVYVRGGLPVIVNEQNEIVHMPHFKVTSRDAEVQAVVRFKPALSVEDLLHYSHYHAY